MVLPASDFFETGGPATAKTEGPQGSKIIGVAANSFQFFIFSLKFYSDVTRWYHHGLILDLVIV